MYSRDEESDCYNEPCGEVRHCLEIASACGHCGRYPVMTRAGYEYHYAMDAGGCRWSCWMDYLLHCHPKNAFCLPYQNIKFEGMFDVYVMSPL